MTGKDRRLRSARVSRYQTRGQVVNVNQKPEVKYPVTAGKPSALGEVVPVTEES